ncbi:3-oxoadipyl-CoA thiolase [Hyaloraphidium curvatum]|nr:3-oxoadipyl-CoA thiolase [Hyaloraphidium curvatum]
MANEAYIVSAVRTAGGRKNGRLSQWNPADLGGLVVKECLRRAGIPTDSAHPQREGPADVVDDVVVGCVTQVGAQAGNVGRNMVLAAGLPESVPATTVNRACGSSLQAIQFAAQAVTSGMQDVVVAAGVEVMSKVPIGSAVTVGAKNGLGSPAESAGMNDRYPGVTFTQFEGAEMVADKFGLSRAEMEAVAVESHRRAARATAEGRFKREILPVTGIDPKNPSKAVLHDADEGIRAETSASGLAALPPLRKGGKITAGLSSQICDGAAACLIVNKAGLAKLRAINPEIRPRARIVAATVIGEDPIMMLAGPIKATKKVLEKAKMRIEDIDLYEVNEAFCSVPLAWAKALNADMDKLNVNGGAMSLGHPLGGTGVKLMTTLLHELERTGKRYGLEAICEGGGMANAIIVERLGENEASSIVAKL